MQRSTSHDEPPPPPPAADVEEARRRALAMLDQFSEETRYANDGAPPVPVKSRESSLTRQAAVDSPAPNPYKVSGASRRQRPPARPISTLAQALPNIRQIRQRWQSLEQDELTLKQVVEEENTIISRRKVQRQITLTDQDLARKLAQDNAAGARTLQAAADAAQREQQITADMELAAKIAQMMQLPDNAKATENIYRDEEFALIVARETGVINASIDYKEDLALAARMTMEEIMQIEEHETRRRLMEASDLLYAQQLYEEEMRNAQRGGGGGVRRERSGRKPSVESPAPAPLPRNTSLRGRDDVHRRASPAPVYDEEYRPDSPEKHYDRPLPLPPRTAALRELDGGDEL